jgi:hypothetical protein
VKIKELVVGVVLLTMEMETIRDKDEIDNRDGMGMKEQSMGQGDCCWTIVQRSVP